MRTRTEIKEGLLDAFADSRQNDQLVIANAQLAVLIELALDIRELLSTDPELREFIKPDEPT